MQLRTLLRVSRQSYTCRYRLSLAFTGPRHFRQMSEAKTRSQPDFVEGSAQHIEKKLRLDDHAAAPAPAETADPEAPKVKVPSKKDLKRARRRERALHTLPEPYSNEDVLWKDIVGVLGQETVDSALEDGTEYESPFQFKDEIEVDVKDISSSGAFTFLCI